MKVVPVVRSSIVLKILSVRDRCNAPLDFELGLGNMQAIDGDVKPVSDPVGRS